MADKRVKVLRPFYATINGTYRATKVGEVVSVTVAVSNELVSALKAERVPDEPEQESKPVRVPRGEK